MSNVQLVVFIGGLTALAAFAMYKAFKILNSPDGERYLKMRTQGPFVPLSSEEIFNDEMRKKNQS